jgi:hypothetical protein
MIATIIIISLFCNGIYLTTRQGMILFFLHNWYLEVSKGFFRSDGEIEWIYKQPTILKFFYKPLFGCLPCMASIWGTVAYYGLGNALNWEYPIIIISCVFVNIFINTIYELLYNLLSKVLNNEG